MWRGWAPSCQRAALVQIGDLTSYDYFKQTILSWGFEDGPTCHAMASAGAGLVAATLGTPADVIKTRVMNQPLDANGKGKLYSSTFDCTSNPCLHVSPCTETETRGRVGHPNACALATSSR